MLQFEGCIWYVIDMLNGELWFDDCDFDICVILEVFGMQGGYGIKVMDCDLKVVIVLLVNGSVFYLVCEYLESQVWDGILWVENLFCDYVGVFDDVYSWFVFCLMMVVVVMCIFELGYKFDFVVIFEGLQGKCKFIFIQMLGKSWFVEFDGDFYDLKQMIELMQGVWIMEILELFGFNCGDVCLIKVFISWQKDCVCLVYVCCVGLFLCQCIFIGFMNDKEYLKDDIGGWWFWLMFCIVVEIDIVGLEVNVDQFWVEVLVFYKVMCVVYWNSVLVLRVI